MQTVPRISADNARVIGFYITKISSGRKQHPVTFLRSVS